MIGQSGLKWKISGWLLEILLLTINFDSLEDLLKIFETNLKLLKLVDGDTQLGYLQGTFITALLQWRHTEVPTNYGYLRYIVENITNLLCLKLDYFSAQAFSIRYKCMDLYILYLNELHWIINWIFNIANSVIDKMHMNWIRVRKPSK